MGIVKVLKRKDAASVVLAVTIGMILLQLVTTVTPELAGKISGLEEGQYVNYSFPGATWQSAYLFPVVSAALQLIALEILVWLYVGVHGLVAKKK